MSEFPEIAQSRPLWLVTLADLALLLLGFMVLVQATAAPEREALSRSFREAFGAEPPAPMPVAAVAARFAPGSAELADPAALVAWARDAARDPRVAFSVSSVAEDGNPLLAADRARAVAVALAGVVPPARLRLATDPLRRGDSATVTLAFAGERP